MIDHKNLASHSLDLVIAGIGLRLICNEIEVIKVLRNRYQDFLKVGQPHLIAELTIQGRHRPSSLLDPGLVFKKKGLQFTAEGYEGFVSHQEGKAELCLSSIQPVEDIEYFLRICYAILAFENAGFLFHAAGIVKENQAYLFFGHSGSGKTTVARVSKQYLVLNDDLVMLVPETKLAQDKPVWMAYATPFWNPTQVKPSAQRAPIAGLYRLVQNKNVFLEAMSKGQALAELISNVPVIPDDPQRNDGLIHRCLQILTTIPAHRLHFLPDDSFWKVIKPGGKSPSSRGK